VISHRVVAFCTAAVPFSENQILKREIAARYPGAVWIPDLADKLARRGISMMTGDVALRKIRSGEIQPHDVSLIAEDRSSDADELIRLGAKGKVLFCCESPLFAASFYRSLPQVSKDFEHCMVFQGAAQDAAPSVAVHPLYFPSFDVAHLRAGGGPWSARKHLVMIAGNKYWKIRRTPIRWFAAKIRDLALRSPERFSKKYASLQLHDARLAAISYFGHKGLLDLFGNGWKNLSNLPSHWQKELSSTISRLNPAPCVDKQATMGAYKFALCFENIEFPGYVTEKVIDCLAAGIVPIYWGAPNIREYLPDTCFIDGRKFTSLAELDAHLEKISENEWVEMLKRGCEFLKSDAGHRLSYKGFTDQMEAALIN
jgi:hypothetical protein